MTAGEPIVSVIIPAYNVGDFIADALRSLQAQTMDCWEAIIIDDGSTDHTVASVEPFLSDPRISLHRFGNGGVTVARNRGIGIARGHLIALLDGDDLYEPSYLARAVEAMDASPEAAFFCCNAIMFGVPSRENRLYSDFEPQELPITLERVLARQFNIFGLTTMRANVLRSVGGFDESLHSAEDFDLWVRLVATGRPVCYAAEPLIRYRRRALSLSNDPSTFIKSHILVYAKAVAAYPIESEISAICRNKIKEYIARSETYLIRRATLEDDTSAATALARAAQFDGHTKKWRFTISTLVMMPAVAKAMIAYRERRATDMAMLSRGAVKNGLD